MKNEQWKKAAETENCIYFQGNLSREVAVDIAEKEKKTVVILEDGVEIINSEVIRNILATQQEEERKAIAKEVRELIGKRGRTVTREEILSIIEAKTPPQ
jgi:hypothetical protein